MIRRISFSKFSDVLSAGTCASAVGNLRSICLGANILSSFPCGDFNGNIALLKVLRVNSRPTEHLRFHKYRFFSPHLLLILVNFITIV